MKTKPFLISLFVMLGLVVATTSTFFLGKSLIGPRPVSASGNPTFSQADLPSQTVNGITAQIQSYSADANRLAFVVRILGPDGTDYSVDGISLLKAGENISDSSEVRLASDDAALFSGAVVMAAPLDEECLDCQLVFQVLHGDGEEPALADFQFDLALPAQSSLTFNPKQSISSNGVEILLDRVVMTSSFTQVYLCYVPPSNADWGITANTATLQVGSQIGQLETYNLLFDDKLADGSKGGESGWTPPVKVGRCVKIGFRVGDVHPKSVTLRIAALEQSINESIPEDDLAAAYKKLRAQGIDMEWHQVDHGAYPEYKKLPEGVTQEQAFRHFYEALGYIYPGEWIFDLSLGS